ncbi:hypothetical protein [Pontimicrobium sp. SW4]|uniref:Uncharacterized protein n=1 Tax=Pontimicrobium sp. SW4 TaxID=3153519 RepID=A0AAU7BRY5_9FLAO
MEYGSELSVSDMEDLGENIIDNADRKSCEQLNIQFDSYVKFHDVDDSIKLLIDSPQTEFIS